MLLWGRLDAPMWGMLRREVVSERCVSVWLGFWFESAGMSRADLEGRGCVEGVFGREEECGFSYGVSVRGRGVEGDQA
ncbi:hypothetical protein [Bartonella schoenbuchensis]|uniref:hypothetical protein n=1 Tax=Bartonella schoenbuchensis TaxID=165694 RepID=UPI000555D906|nr:hypothetical protein [Bartonella schoenbuchensis]